MGGATVGVLPGERLERDMRVLFTTWAWPSHLFSLVPLAWAFRAAGHEVIVASQPALLPEIGRVGLPGAAVGTDVDAVDLVRGYVLPAASEVAGNVAGNVAGDESGNVARTGRGPRALRMLRAHAESMVDGLVALAKDWRPDLVVFEPTALAGPIAAAAVGVPAVRQLYGTDLLLRARGLLPELLAPVAQRVGVGEFDPFGVVTVDPVPTSAQLPVDYPRIAMRYVPFNGAGVRPEPLPHKCAKRVGVTWGHTMARLDPRLFLAGEVAAELSDVDDVELVVLVSREQRELLPELPAETRILVDVPVHQVVGECDLLVGHGGAGTVLTAVAAGVPMLLVPQLPDHAGHAARVLATGAGAVLTRDEADPARIRAETRRLLDSAAHRAAVLALRAESRRAATPAEVVTELVTTLVEGR